MSQKPEVDLSQIARWLSEKYDGTVAELAPISGGFWSVAYTFRVGDEPLVLRLSDLAEGFALDAAAMQFGSADLPIPTVHEVGEAFGHHYAISRRHFGRFLEEVSVDDADVAGAALAHLLAALRAVPAPPNAAVVWHDPAASSVTWHDFLRGGLRDNPTATASGWRSKLAENHHYEAVFQACVARIEALLPLCPERRDLVHGDLLHQNVLISDDATRVTAIFSWKCAVFGDFLYDVAWCTVWGPWHPGIAVADLWQRTIDAPDLTSADLQDAPLRHHCYELQIAASHFGWNVWTGNDQALAEVVARAENILKRGPLPIGQAAAPLPSSQNIGGNARLP